MVQVIIEILSGVIDQVTVFQFREDAQRYYEDKGGPELEDSQDSKYEIKWFEDITVRCIPVEIVK